MSMEFYIAHIIMYYEYIDGNQDDYYCWEDMILVQGKSYKEAYDKAMKIAKKNEDYSGKCMHNGRPVNIVCKGNRQVVSIDYPYDKVIDRTEVTYLTLTFETKEQFESYVTDNTAIVTYTHIGYKD